MTRLTPDIAAEVVAACTAGAPEAAGALGRTFDGTIKLGAPAPGTLAAAQPGDLEGPGLLVLFAIGDEGVALVLPESSGLLPTWCAAPDATGKSKLATLAQELSVLFVPESLAVDAAEARYVGSLREALTAGGAANNATLVSLAVSGARPAGALSLVWPLTTPAAILDAGADVRSASNVANRAGKSKSLGELPHYSRSLLKIRIPVSVELASKKETVQEVVEIVPGAIIKFDKGCDELLQMVVGGQAIAQGEAVKIGDKFGFRVTGMLMPHEHFVRARRPRAG